MTFGLVGGVNVAVIQSFIKQKVRATHSIECSLVITGKAFLFASRLILA